MLTNYYSILEVALKERFPLKYLSIVLNTAIVLEGLYDSSSRLRSIIVL